MGKTTSHPWHRSPARQKLGLRSRIADHGRRRVVWPDRLHRSNLPPSLPYDVRQRQPDTLPDRVHLRCRLHPSSPIPWRGRYCLQLNSGRNCYAVSAPLFIYLLHRKREPMAESRRCSRPVVCFSYNRPIVRDVSFSLMPGTITGIIGPNGSGKTTILRLLDGIIAPLSGEVVLRGNTPLSSLKRKEIARHIAMVPQNGGSYFYQTVFQFAIQGRSPHLSLMGFESMRDEEIAREVLEMTQLSHYLDARVSELSGGEKQRCCWRGLWHNRPRYCSLTNSRQIWTSTTRWS